MTNFVNPATADLNEADDEEVCWICLEGGSCDNELLKMPCKCPRSAHSKCVARWQLQSAGTRKETHCEFCDCELPAWKDTFIPTVDQRADPIMNVTFNGVTRGFRVAPGPEGYKKFTSEIQNAFKLPADSDLNIIQTQEIQWIMDR